MKPPKYSNLPARFWDKVEVAPSGCWLWTAGTFPNGYGEYWWNGKHWHAHRVMAIHAKGQIPDGLWVLHTCDIRKCVNPEHLYFGNHQDNMNDMKSRGRGVVPDNRGSRNSSARLTEDNVLSIRDYYAARTADSIAKEFGVTRQHIVRIVNRKVWTHV